MINLKTVFKQSVPVKKLKTTEIVKKLLAAIGLIYFIFVFLEPFDFNIGDHNKYVVFLWFSLAYFLVLFTTIKWILPLVNKFTNVRVFHFYHFILGYLFLVILVAFVHHALQNYLNDQPIIDISLFFNILYHAVLIGLIPTVILSLASYNRALKKQVNASVKDLTSFLKKVEQKGIITIKSNNGKDYYRFDASSIIYIKSEDNYVNIIHLNNKTSAIESELIRATLKNVENNMSNPFLRIHRSYLVNLNHVHKISGNSQGMQLFIKLTEESLPVSRSYINALKKALHNH
ncbi:hypothetical protein GTQ40_08440 [Flavobacteriaceae bacterium R38]|nr:hypothetical protein [Flavobacteriaceae bacterium R38]